MEKSKSDIEKVMEYSKQAWQDIKIAMPLISNNIYKFLPVFMFSYATLPILSIETTGVAILLCIISFILTILLSNYLDVLKQNNFCFFSLFLLFFFIFFIILLCLYNYTSRTIINIII